MVFVRYQFTLVLAFLAVGYGGLTVGGFALLPSSWVILCAALVALVVESTGLRKRIPYLEPFLLLLVVIAVSDIVRRRMSMLNIGSIQLILLGVMTLAAIGASAIRRNATVMIVIISGAALISAVAGFFISARGRLLFGDDHAPFLYRLMQLTDYFPRIPFYNPLWNAGVEAREFFPSGTLGPFFLFSPLIAIIGAKSAYTVIVGTLLFVVTPLSMAAAARLAGFRRHAILLTVPLSLCANLIWYRWGLVYGTLGFVTAVASLPLALVSGWRIAENSNPPLTHLLIFTLSVSLVLFWPLGLLLLIPVGIVWLRNARRIFTSGRHLAIIAIFFVVHLPWMLLFLKSSGVFTFVLTGVKPGDSTAHARLFPGSPIKGAFRFFRMQVESTYPLVIICGMAGLRKEILGSAVPFLGAIAVYLLVLGTAGPALVPQLELERVLVVLANLMSLPTAAFVADRLSRLPQTVGERVIYGAIVSFTVLTPISIYRIASNQSFERFHFADGSVREVTDAVMRHSGSGRTLFSGFVLHDLSQGHIAPLAAFTGRPMIASSYQHNLWTHVDVLPKQFSDEQGGVFRYLDLMNVTLVLSHEKKWTSWFERRPDHFEKVGKFGKFNFFVRRNYQSNYFLEGTGRILAQYGNRVEFVLDSPDALLKFRHIPALVASGCILTPHALEGGITLVRLNSCPIGVPLLLEAATYFPGRHGVGSSVVDAVN